MFKKKPIIMAKRIKKLYNNLSWLLDTGVYSEINTLEYYECGYHDKGYQIKINTEYGIRELTVCDNELIYSEPKKKSCYFYYKYPIRIQVETRSNILFRIYLKDDKLNVSPYPMTKFSASEIDLAILEFEEFIKPYMIKVKDMLSKHSSVVEFLNRKG